MPKKSPPKRGRGRPPHVPTVTSRRRVAIAAGGGMRHEAIAIALGINVDTLRKYYGAELSAVANAKRMDVLETLHKSAKAGSTSAARAYLAAVPEFEPLPLQPGETAPPPAATAAPAPKPQPTVALGKKELAQIAAREATAGSGWDGLLPSPDTPVQ